MNLQVFCLVGLLCFPEQLAASLLLLPEAQQAEANSYCKSLKDLPRTELLQRWSTLRLEERTALGQLAIQRTGIPLGQLPPSIREYCTSWLVDQHG